MSPSNRLALVKSIFTQRHKLAKHQVVPAAVLADDDLDTFSLKESFLNPCPLGLWRNIKLQVRHFTKMSVPELACGLL